MDLTAFIAENLFSVHALLAGMTGKPMLALDQTEADALGAAIQNVARHYDIPGLNQKAVDFVRLARTAGMIYGTRLFAAGVAIRTPRPAAPPTAVPTAEGSPAPEPKPAGQGNGAAPRGPQTTAKGTWSSPGPGLPDVWMPAQ